MTTELDRWKNRRRMAWVCMFAGVGYPLLVLASSSRELGEIAMPFYMFVSAVVGAYVGFASWEDVKMNQTQVRHEDEMSRSGRDYRNNLDYTNARF